MHKLTICIMMMEMPNQPHHLKVQAIQKQIKDAYKRKQSVKLYHGSTNSLRRQDYRNSKVIDISDMDEIIDVDVEQRFAITEPNVPMDKLLQHTLKYDLMPLIVMEFPGITVGGAIQGGATESSAFKYGGFHDTCVEYEIILGNGDLLTVNKNNHNDLYKETACSYGTLGIITKVKLRLVPASRHVQLTYYRVNSFEEARELMLQQTTQKHDFIDGIMFASNRGVVMTGDMVNVMDFPRVTFHKFHDEWFYRHAEKIAAANKKYVEVTPITDYLFRYDRGAFWMARYVFTIMRTPFNRFTRFVFSPFCTTRFLYRQLHAANLSQRFIVQDLCIPESNVCKFLEYIDRRLHSYPLWLLPITARESAKSLFTPLTGVDDIAINVGVWTEAKNIEEFMAANLEIESEVHALGGRKTLYAHAYYTEDEFWSIYDKAAYAKLRKKYFADTTFRDIYSKVVVNEKYKSSIAKAIVHLATVKLPKS
jgi:delta24-sterol reductase